MTQVVSAADLVATDGAPCKAADDGSSPVGLRSAKPSKLSADLMSCRRLPSPRHGTLMIVNGVSREAEPLMRSGVEAANHLGAHLLSLSYSPYRINGIADPVEEKAERRLLEVEGERFEALSSSVRGGRTWVPSTRAMLPSISALAWWADLVMLNADELGEGAGAWRRLSDIAHTLKTPTLVRPVGVERASLDSVVLVSEASTASQETIRRALPLILKAHHVKILASDRSGDVLKSGLLARGLKASSVEVQRTRPVQQAREILTNEVGHVVVYGRAFGRHPGLPFGDLGRAPLTEHRSILLV